MFRAKIITGIYIRVIQNQRTILQNRRQFCNNKHQKVYLCTFVFSWFKHRSSKKKSTRIATKLYQWINEFLKIVFLPFESKIFSFSFISADTTYSTRDIFSHIQVCFYIPHKLFCIWRTVNPWMTSRDPSSGIPYYFRKKHEHCEMFLRKLYFIMKILIFKLNFR